MTAVPQPPNSIGEYGHWTVRINARDHVAGTTVFPDDTIHAWLTRNGVATDLNPEAIGSEVTAMNDSDAVVGWTRYAINTPYIAALWRNGKTTLLNELPGFLGQANSINNRGWVVGDVCDVTCIAFVFNGTKMFDLNTLLNESSAGWTLSQATGINDAGVIVGAGFFKGAFHAFMATPVQ